MKVFSNYKEAYQDYNTKKLYYLNSKCPWNKKLLCGNWCALCKIDLGDGSRSPHVILGCKSDIKIYIDNIIE